MSTTTIAPSFEDFLAQGQAAMQSSRPDLAFREGDMTVADDHAIACMADMAVRLAIKLLRATFMDFAEDDDLDRLINDRYGLTRFAATAAQGQVTFHRGTALTAGTIPAGTVVSTSFDAGGGQVSFATDANVIVGIGVTDVAANVTAQNTGPSGNVAAAAIKQISGSLFDTFTVTNPLATGGGNLAESNDDFKARARNFFQTLRRGTIAALEEGAKQVPTVRIDTVVENGTSGLVDLLVSDADGNSTLQMAMDVAVEIENWRAAGILVQVVGGQRLVVDMALGLVCRQGFDPLAVSDNLVAGVETRMGRLRVGERLYLDMVVSALVAQYPDDILDVQFFTITVGGVASPIDIDFIAPLSSFGQVIRPGTITVAAALP